MAVVEEGLKPHAKLPAVRKLAELSGFNPSTVVTALNLLESEGVIYKREGSGTYVSPASFVPSSAPEPVREKRIDFTSPTPSPEYFPVADFKEAFNIVLDRDKGHAFSYPEQEGYLPLRLTVADYLSSQGLVVSPEMVQITSGAQQALSLLAQVLLKPGDGVAIENPTYPGAVLAFNPHGARLLPVNIGYNGPTVKTIEALQKSRVRLYYAVPNFQNPTGTCYGDKVRSLLVELARQEDFYIIEDDHASELYYTPSAPRTLWELAPDRVLFIKSFSKLFMPGLRLGFMLLPPELKERVNLAKQAADLGSPGINQRVLDHYLRQDKWLEHISFLRQTYKHRMDTMVTALQRELQSRIAFTAPRGGMNLWLTLPRGVAADGLRQKLLSRGVAVSPGSEYSLDGVSFSGNIRLSVANTFPGEIEEGVRVLSQTLSV
jgi:DNA-binding transcriptional MocR family regulator